MRRIKQEHKRIITFIHVIRGVAPLLVVWSHLAWWLIYNKVVWEPYRFVLYNIALPTLTYQNFGHLGVMLFFLVSGFIISFVLQSEGRTEFIIKRVFRIFPALIVVCFLSYLLEALNLPSSITPLRASVDLPQVAASSLMLDFFIFNKSYIVGVRWSLVPEIIFYLSVVIGFTSLRASNLYSSWGMLVIFSALVLTSGLSSYFTYMSHFTVYLPLFLIGRTFYLYYFDKISVLECLLFASTALTTVITLVYLKFPLKDGSVNLPRLMTYVYATAIFFAAMSINTKKIPAFISFLGNISYSVYLVHVPVLAVTLSFLPINQIGVTTSIIIALINILFFSYILNRYVEVPCQRIGRQLLKKLRPSPVKQRFLGSENAPKGGL